MYAGRLGIKSFSRLNAVELIGCRCLTTKQTFLEQAYGGWKYLTGQIPPTQRENEELHELKMAFLSIHHRRLLDKKPLGSLDDELDKIWRSYSLKGNIGMRYEVQVELSPDILDLFEIFHDVDRRLIAVDETEILKQDYEDTLLEECEYPEKHDFLFLKREALEILIRHFDPQAPITAKPLPWEETGEATWENLVDSFGYNGRDASDDVLAAIRQHQRRNMVRSFLIKQVLGYSVLALKSCIPDAGRGVYVDGEAPPGAIIAFFPGQIWPREYLLDPTKEVLEYFSGECNPNFQLHFRGDDFLVDSRASPYTVLENPWAIGHIANHAPITKSNTRTMGINFFEKMEIGATLSRYIPNEYAKPPTILGGKLLDRDVIDMHGMCLLNKRKALKNQEVLYDYRLMCAPEEGPLWYEHVEYNLTLDVEQEC